MVELSAPPLSFGITMTWNCGNRWKSQLSHMEMMNRFAKAVFFGNNQEFQVATKQEQEKIILCRRLIQNAIVLWNYLYLSDLLAKVDSRPLLEEMLSVIRNGTAVTWQHVNLLG